MSKHFLTFLTVQLPRLDPIPARLSHHHPFSDRLLTNIYRAKDNGDMAVLREVAEDPHGFILRQGWASLDFTDEIELVQLRRLHETLPLEIAAVLESLST